MFSLLADAASDAASVAYPVGGSVLFLTMLKMVWTVYTNGSKTENALRTTFANERASREKEFTADFAKAKIDYSESLIRHQQIYAAEVKALQDRIAGYIEQQASDHARIERLEGEVTRLDTDLKASRAQ